MTANVGALVVTVHVVPKPISAIFAGGTAVMHMIPPEVSDEFAVRFHLHPAVKANKLTDGHGAMLMLPNRDVWTFNAYEDRVEIEESVYLSGADGPRRAVQIVIYGHAREHPKVKWSFGHTRPVAPGTRAARADEPELPL